MTKELRCEERVRLAEERKDEALLKSLTADVEASLLKLRFYYTDIQACVEKCNQYFGDAIDFENRTYGFAVRSKDVSHDERAVLHVLFNTVRRVLERRVGESYEDFLEYCREAHQIVRGVEQVAEFLNQNIGAHEVIQFMECCFNDLAVSVSEMCETLEDYKGHKETLDGFKKKRHHRD